MNVVPWQKGAQVYLTCPVRLTLGDIIVWLKDQPGTVIQLVGSGGVRYLFLENGDFVISPHKPGEHHN